MPRIDATELRTFASRVIRALGSPDAVAETVADSLVAADCRGHGSHGVRRLVSFYPRMIESGNIKPSAEPVVVREAPTSARVDGQWGWGHVTGRFATDLAIEKAQANVVGIVGVNNGTHMGRIGEYAERAAASDISLVAFANTGGVGRSTALPGTASRNISANPIVVGVPSFDALPFDLVLDMSSSQTAHGKIMQRAIAGEALSENWVVDDEGAALTDAVAFEDGVGAILPLGGREFGHKGAALSLAIEAITGVIGDSPVHGEGRAPMVNNGATFVAIDSTWFVDPTDARRRISRLAAHVRDQAYDPTAVPSPGGRGDHALLPGELEYETSEDCLANGIPIDEGAISALKGIATELGIDVHPNGF